MTPPGQPAVVFHLHIAFQYQAIRQKPQAMLQVDQQFRFMVGISILMKGHPFCSRQLCLYLVF